ASIFILLGFITLQLLNQSAYRETDLSLTQIDANSRAVQLEISRYEQGNPFLENFPGGQPLSDADNNRVNTQVILWSASGEILNKAAIGGRVNQIQGLKLNTKNLDVIQSIDLSDSENDHSLAFRSITRKAESNQSEI